MIKFFRIIRQNLLSDNKFGKYLIYVIGEIILVVIGILIALTLDEKNEERQVRTKVDSIFENVMKELESDIRQGTRIIKWYRGIDSLTALIIGDKLTYDDYKTDLQMQYSIPLWRVGIEWENYDLSTDAYDLLVNNRYAIPYEYDTAMAHLNELHNKFKPMVFTYNQMMKTLVNKNFEDFENNYEWFFNPAKRNEEIEYRLHNYHFKNKVNRYRLEGNRTHRNVIAIYRSKAIEAYMSIAGVLNINTDSLKFIVNKNILEKYEGTYQESSNPDIKVKVYLEKDYLVVNSISSSDRVNIFPLSSGSLFYLNMDNGLVRFEIINNDILMTFYKGYSSTKYRRMNE